MTLDPRAGRLMRMLSASTTDEFSETIQARRQSLADLAILASGPPTIAVTAADLSINGSAGSLRLRRYLSPKAGRAALLFMHGGGWVAGALETHDGVCRSLALESDCQIFSLEYRLAPEHQFPAGLDDGLSAFRWITDNAHALNIDPGRVAIGGDSAGATLATAAALSLAGGRRPPALQLLLCPILDLAAESPSRRRFAEGFFLSARRFKRDVEDYVPQGMDLHDPRLSPLYAKDLSSAPKALIHLAQYDPFQDEATAYAERLRQAGVSVETTVHPGMIHYFYALAGAIPYADAALGQIGRQLRSALTA